ncbi:hypothetical protein WA026_007042 [Henosepilachna vigintioctopunctata]|uniref:Uncharacterized protein n=1 Tax=Henosepilachna vigintioctopunctata TaxID=420089 RepID=A0AAW1V1U4_9CUCU
MDERFTPSTSKMAKFPFESPDDPTDIGGFNIQFSCKNAVTPRCEQNNAIEEDFPLSDRGQGIEKGIERHCRKKKHPNSYRC